MSGTKEKLKKMSDKELAILVKYKINEYLKPTQNEILIHSRERNLTEEKIERLTTNYINSTPARLTLTQKIKNYLWDVISGILMGI